MCSNVCSVRSVFVRACRVCHLGSVHIQSSRASCAWCVPCACGGSHRVIRVKDCTRARAWLAMLVVRTQCFLHLWFESALIYAACSCARSLPLLCSVCLRCVLVRVVAKWASRHSQHGCVTRMLFSSLRVHPARSVFYMLVRVESRNGHFCDLPWIVSLAAARKLLLLLCATIAPTLPAYFVCIACCTMCLPHSPCAFLIAIIAAQLFCVRLRVFTFCEDCVCFMALLLCI